MSHFLNAASVQDEQSHCSPSPLTFTSNLKFTLKAWPVIAGATIGLCFLTQQAASLFGIDLPEQTNVDLVRQTFLHAFDSLRHFGICFANAALVLVVCPVLEELLFRLPTRWLRRYGWWALLSALFSAAHYLSQPWPDNAFLALFFFGLAQCWLFRRTGRILCAMLNHALFNLVNLILLFIIPAP